MEFALNLVGVFPKLMELHSQRSLLVSAFDDSEVPFASDHWTHGNWHRCGLPIKPNHGDDANVVKVRAKRHTIHHHHHHQHHHHRHRHLDDPDGDEIRKVMGGQPVQDGDFPWAVAIYINGRYECTGTLISKRHVLTGAHCFSGDDLTDNEGQLLCTTENWKSMAMAESSVLESSTIRLGSACRNDLQIEMDGCGSGRSQQEFRIKNATYMHFYKAGCLKADYALLELDLDGGKEVPASLANHICLAHLDEQVSQMDWQEQARPIAFGWGSDPLKHAGYADGTARLQKLDYPNIWPKENCMARMGVRFNEDMLCTLEKTSANVCEGDSGGGLISQYEDGQGVQRWFLLGTTSFGSGCKELLNKGTLPGVQVFTNTTFYKDAIDRFMGTSGLLQFKNGGNDCEYV